MDSLTRKTMLEALARLDQKLPEDLLLVIGGGGAMVLAHDFPLSTADIDAIPKGVEASALDPLVKEISKELEIPSDWLNPYYAVFTHVLPSDYSDRWIEVFSGRKLKAYALGVNEMLIMKCFARRQKDIPHARALLRKGADDERVADHIEVLKEKGIPGAQEALDFLDDLLDFEAK